MSLRQLIVNSTSLVLYICKQLTPPCMKGQKYAFGTPKNDKTRTIRPAPYVMQVLKEHKIRQLEQRLHAGTAWDNDGFPNLVFTNEFGKHLTQSGVWKMLQKALRDSNIEYLSFHDLRHPYIKHTTKNNLCKSRNPRLIKNGSIVWGFCLLHPHGVLCQSLYGRFLQSL